jgi:hypothetical protein
MYRLPAVTSSLVTTLNQVATGAAKLDPAHVAQKGHVYNLHIARLVKSVKPQDEKGHGAILDGDREIVRALAKRRYGNRRRAGREIAAVVMVKVR